MNSGEETSGRARPPGAPRAWATRKKLPHDRPLWTRPQDEVFFITVCCERRGKNQLCYAKPAREIFDSVEFRNQNDVCYAHLVLLMPDHLHALISFPSEQPMRQIMGDWKRLLATRLKIDWQRDFFDHRLRKEESFIEKADYIRANPVRAGLIDSSEEWRFIWTVDPQKHANSAGRALRRGGPRGRALPLLLSAMFALASCRPDMANQPRAKPLSESNFFSDGTNARPLPPHVVARGDASVHEPVDTGLTNGAYATQLPIQLTPGLLARGRERHEIFCAECHGQTGRGDGPVVQHGFPRPPPYQLDRIRNAPVGYLFDVMSNGHGTMAGYAAQIEPADRWAIAAYIRSLQQNQNSQPPSSP
jgi:REP element-mobilizing transposase RayT/cytochrome c553